MKLNEALLIIEQQRALIDEQQAEIKRLRDRIDELERVSARQAAPFRREEAKKIPPEQKKKPGRKPGHPGARRAVPKHIDHHVNVPLPCCPKCAGELTSRTPRVQYIEEIPPLRPVVTRLVTWQGKCPCCGDVETSHRLQTSRGQGVAGVQIGPRARSLLVLLNKHLGVTLRKTSSLLRNAFGLSITPGGVAHNLARSARQTELTYEQLIDDVRRSPVVYADETSWWVNEPKWWLWTFTTPATTVYRVERRRNADVVHDTLREFDGLLVSDCLSSYDVAPYRKHKCVAHHLRAIKHASELPDTKDTRYLDRWKMLFKSLISLTHEREHLSVADFARRRGALERLADELLAEACVQSCDARVRNRLKKQRAHLFGCLDEPTAEATNNRAERSLRPAVIARKLSCGNRTEQGKRTFEILASLAATIHQRGEDLLAVLTKSLSLCPQAG